MPWPRGLTTASAVFAGVACVMSVNWALNAAFSSIPNWFLLPSEVGNMYAKAGMEKPVTGVTGFWNLIPIVGFFIWVFKVQNAINRRWETAGAM